jgi:phage terminase small subunit
MGLNSKQKIFVKEYLVDKNATKAAERAGYSAKSARVDGSRLLTNADIAAAIEDGLAIQLKDAQDRAAKRGLTKDRWLQELELVAFSNMDEFATIEEIEVKRWEGSDEDGEMISDVSTRIKLIPTMERKAHRGRVIKSISETTTQHGGSSKIELHNKLQALEVIGKAYGWVKDQVAFTPGEGAQVILRIYKNGSEAPDDNGGT